MSALVTGAGGAIGRAIAVRLAQQGQAIGVLDVDRACAERTVEALGDEGHQAVPIIADLRSAPAIEDAVTACERALGPVEVLVNNAAVFPSGPFLDVTPADFDDTMTVNARAYFLCAQSAARSMVASATAGAIVNVASIVWHGYWSDMAGYVAAKGAVVAMTRAMARELGVNGIRVNAVAPGAFATAAEQAQHPDMAAYERRILDAQAIKRRGRTEELAAAVAFLAGPDASFITGQTLNVDGGWVMW